MNTLEKIQKNLENFKFLHSQLKYHNKINIDIDHIEKNSLIPMIYPFLINKDIRNNLIRSNLFINFVQLIKKNIGLLKVLLNCH